MYTVIPVPKQANLQRMANLIFLSFIRLRCCRYLPASLHGVIIRKNIVISTAVRTSDLTLIRSLVCLFFRSYSFCLFFLPMRILCFPFLNSYPTEVFTRLSTPTLQRFLPTLFLFHPHNHPFSLNDARIPLQLVHCN
jgi:hypothetical protein